MGNIILDKFSNRYLNITLLGGTGSIVGTVKVTFAPFRCSFVLSFQKNTTVYNKYDTSHISDVIHPVYCLNLNLFGKTNLIPLVLFSK